MRETSIEAYHAEEDLGKIGKRRLQVVEALMRHGPMTANECWRIINQQDPSILQHSISPRFAELRDRGFLAEDGERECAVTRKTAIVWKFVRKESRVLRPKKESKLSQVRVALAHIRKKHPQCQCCKEIIELINLIPV